MKNKLILYSCKNSNWNKWQIYKNNPKNWLFADLTGFYCCNQCFHSYKKRKNTKLFKTKHKFPWYFSFSTNWLNLETNQQMKRKIKLMTNSWIKGFKSQCRHQIDTMVVQRIHTLIIDCLSLPVLEMMDECSSITLCKNHLFFSSVMRNCCTVLWFAFILLFYSKENTFCCQKSSGKIGNTRRPRIEDILF